MDRTQVDSSNISSIGYDSDKLTLEVEFRTGKVYQYWNVPKDVYDALIASESKGKYFHSEVRSKYACGLVGLPPDTPKT